MPLDSPRMVVPSALPLNLICDETWPPPRKFSAYATEDEILHTTSFFMWLSFVLSFPAVFFTYDLCSDLQFVAEWLILSAVLRALSSTPLL